MDYRELEYLGLSEKEAKVYLAALELGKSPVQKIAQKAGVNRATTYVIIEGLMKKGLISSIQKDKKQLFNAEAPEKLNLLFREQVMAIQRKQEYLDKLLPDLRSLKASDKDKPSVRYFEGRDGMRVIAEEIFNTKHDDDVRMIYSYDLLLKMFTEEEIAEMRKKRQNKHIPAKIITNDDQNRLKTDAEVLRILTKEYGICSDIAIYGNKTRMITQKSNPAGLIIENKEISKTLKILFDIAWEYLKLKKKKRGPKS
ncbi:TrmB family transcriptional regulator [Patescibacteria group bacterium]